MRSFTSSSDLRRATIALFAVLALLLGAAELGGRLFARVSRIQRRTEAERAALFAPASHPVVLIVGNSLLLEGLDLPRFSQALQPGWEVRRYIVEQTYYYDWYYGLHRLFREGVRPQVVLLGLNAPQFASQSYRGDYAARYLFDAADIPRLARDAHTDLTTSAGLLLAHYSAFYALRGNIRQYLLHKPMPGYFSMAQRFFLAKGQTPAPDQLTSRSVARLRALRDLCRQYGSEFLFTVPPSNQPGQTALVDAGRSAGVPVLAPILDASLEQSYYRDQFHLNERGAELYTSALAEAVVKQLNAASVPVHAGAGLDSPHP